MPTANVVPTDIAYTNGRHVSTIPVFLVSNTGGGAVVETSSTTTNNANTFSITANNTSSIALLANNASRLSGTTIANDSSAILYLILGTGTANSTNFTVAIDAKTTVPGYYVLPEGFTGTVNGRWSAQDGAARITEIIA